MGCAERLVTVGRERHRFDHANKFLKDGEGWWCLGQVPQSHDAVTRDAVMRCAEHLVAVGREQRRYDPAGMCPRRKVAVGGD